MKIEALEINTAPEDAQPWLQEAANSMGGFLPTLYREMANAPAVLEAYLTLSKILGKTSFSPAEQQLILLTASARNGCTYCVAAHSSGAHMAKLDRDAITAVRDGKPAADEKLEALRSMVEDVIQTRGKVSDERINQFLAAGYTKTQLMELIIGISMKSLSNSFARMFGTEVEKANAAMAWEGNENV